MAMMKDTRMEHNVKSCLRYGLVLASDFSGQLSAEVAVKMSLRGLSQIVSGPGLTDKHCLLYSACDVAPESRLLCMASEVRHVFPEILSQIPEKNATDIMDLRPLTHKGPSTTHYKVTNAPKGDKKR
eukprot:12500619-Alexandrium_andersonii.AAC.1